MPARIWNRQTENVRRDQLRRSGSRGISFYWHRQQKRQLHQSGKRDAAAADKPNS